MKTNKILGNKRAYVRPEIETIVMETVEMIAVSAKVNSDVVDWESDGTETTGSASRYTDDEGE